MSRENSLAKGSRVISDILEISNNLRIKGFLMTLNSEKAFDSVNHLFLITVLEKYGKEVPDKVIQFLYLF